MERHLLSALPFLLIFDCGLTFSADEFMSCDRFYQSTRRARLLEEIPCDMGSSMFCEKKGSSYPEAAIWRFKEENRALMKRMYGDLESRSLYREMRAGNLGESSRPGPPPPHDIFSSLQYDIRVGSGFQKESKLIKKVIRKKIRAEASSRAPQPPLATATTLPVSTTVVTESETPDFSKETSSLSPPPLTTTGEQMTTTTARTVTSNTTAALSSNRRMSTAEPVTDGEEGATPTLANKYYTIPFEEEATSTTVLEDGEHLTASASVSTIMSTTSNFLETSSSSRDDGIPTSTSPYPMEAEFREDPEDRDPPFTGIITPEDPIFVDVFTEKEVVELEESSDEELEGFKVDSSQEEYDYDGPSENACPVKQEVLAPFWANNTRDQVLALLNLYPFEQYIHMETCELENRQFRCHEGCRCEQQYRLHRLLAFDPTNECRGIFSDWFRFPSYCVCKCYQKKPPLPGGSSHAGRGRLRRKPRLSGKQGIPRKRK